MESRPPFRLIPYWKRLAFALFEKGDYNGAKEMYNKLENSKLKELFLERCEKAIGEGKNN